MDGSCDHVPERHRTLLLSCFHTAHLHIGCSCIYCLRSKRYNKIYLIEVKKQRFALKRNILKFDFYYLIYSLSIGGSGYLYLLSQTFSSALALFSFLISFLKSFINHLHFLISPCLLRMSLLSSVYHLHSNPISLSSSYISISQRFNLSIPLSSLFKCLTHAIDSLL